MLTVDVAEAGKYNVFRRFGGGDRRALLTTQFTRRARATLISKPTLPPARVQRLVIRPVESGVEYYGRHRRTLSPMVKAIVCVVICTVTWSLSRP